MCVCVFFLVCHLNNLSSEWPLPRGVLGNGICAAQMGAQLLLQISTLATHFPHLLFVFFSIPFSFSQRICLRLLVSTSKPSLI